MGARFSWNVSSGRSCSGQGEAEGGSMAELAVDPDSTPVRLHDALGNGETEAEPASPLARGLPIAIEDMREMGVVDARPGIADAELHFVGHDLGRQRDGATLRGELERIADQVRKDLMNTFA